MPPRPATLEELTALVFSIYPPELLGGTAAAATAARPFVTLTYARSSDGKIAGVNGAQIQLSGPEAMLLTHRLRELHDSILVGVGTVLHDDPQLTARLPTLLPRSSQPRPLILDTALRTPLEAKLINNGNNGISWSPVIYYAENEGTNVRARCKEYEELGVTMIPLVTGERKGRLRLEEVVARPELGRALMIEGGSSVITSFLASGLADLVIVTIAPHLVGDGVGIKRESELLASMETVWSFQLGIDTVNIYRPWTKRS